MKEISLGTVYDINKNCMSKEKNLPPKTYMNRLKKIGNFFQEGKQYYMLLCHEERNYTLFDIADKNKIDKAITALKECLDNRGSVLSIDKTEDDFAFEIWLKKIDGEVVCYFLFPYDEGIIKVGE